MEKLFSLSSEVKPDLNEAGESLGKKNIDLDSPLGFERPNQRETKDNTTWWPKGDFVVPENLDRPLSEGHDVYDHPKEVSEWLKGEVLPTDELDKPLAGGENLDEGLSPEQKQDLKDKTGWSDEIVDYIKTEEEGQVYLDAKLKEVNGNLERTDIDWNAKIPQDRIDRMRTRFGDEVADKWAEKTNLDLIKVGKAPYGPDGQQVNLHHIGQKSDSPLAELTNTEHKQNDGVLHDKTKESEIDRQGFSMERQQYWMARYESLTQQA